MLSKSEAFDLKGIPALHRFNSDPLHNDKHSSDFWKQLDETLSEWDSRVNEDILSDPDISEGIRIADLIPIFLPEFLAKGKFFTRIYTSRINSSPMSTELEVLISKKIRVSLCYLPLNARTTTRRANNTEILICIFGDIAVKGVLASSEEGNAFHYERSYNENDESLSAEETIEKELKVGEKINLGPRKPIVISQGGLFSLKGEKESFFLKIDQIFPPNLPATYVWSSSESEPIEVRGPPSLSKGLRDSDQSRKIADHFIELIKQFNMRTTNINNKEMILFRSAFKDSFKHRCRILSSNIKDRAEQILMPVDSTIIRSIAESLCLWIFYDGSVAPESPEEWKIFKPRDLFNFENGAFVEVMKRLVLYEDEWVQIRLHLFPDGAETYVHNHSGNFFSVCLRGKYHHHTWFCDDSKTESSYTKQLRSTGGGLGPEIECVGEISKKETFIHDTLNTYFLHRNTFHTVDQTSGGVLTMFIRDKKSLGPTFVLNPKGSLLSLESGKETVLTDSRLSSFITKVDKCIKEAGKILLN